MKLLSEYQALSLVRRLQPEIDKNPRWVDLASCCDEDPELFFPIGNTGPAIRQIEDAREVCDRCPVEAECLVWALTNNVCDGVWGGTSESERQTIKRRMRRAIQAENARNH